MADVPILGETKQSGLTAEEEALLAKAEAAGQIPDPRTKVTTAFLVVVEANGNVFGTHDLSIVEQISIDRPAGADDMYGALANVQKDLQAVVTAQQTHGLMMQMARQAQEQAQAAQIAAQIKQGGKLHV